MQWKIQIVNKGFRLSQMGSLAPELVPHSLGVEEAGGGGFIPRTAIFHLTEHNYIPVALIKSQARLSGSGPAWGPPAKTRRSRVLIGRVMTKNESDPP